MKIAQINTGYQPKLQNRNKVPNFQGKQYPSGYYSDDEIALAKRFINQIGDEWRKMYKEEKTNSFSKHYDESVGLNGAFVPIVRLFSRPGTLEDDAQVVKFILNFFTGCLWELVNSPINATEALIRKHREAGRIDSKTARVATLICDMQREESNKEITEQLKKLNDITNDQEQRLAIMKNKEDLYQGYIRSIFDEKQGNDADIPNAIMIEGSNKKLGEDLVDYARQEAGVYFATVNENNVPKMQKDFYNALKNAKDKYEETGNRTLIEVKGMDKLVSKDTEFRVTEWMKAKLTACAEDYKATVIFQTPDSSNFVEEIREPHRVGINLKV